jgi:hypothetical protein
MSLPVLPTTGIRTEDAQSGGARCQVRPSVLQIVWRITDEMARTIVRLYYGVAVPCFLNKKSGESMRH